MKLFRMLLVVALWGVGMTIYLHSHPRGFDRLVIPYRDVEIPPIVAQTREVFPHSVVPGGVRSGTEIREAAAANPVVDAHYADLQPLQMRAVRLVRDTPAYVSFFREDGIYWTRGKIVLHKGEMLLTDGENWIRSRCGNRISSEPRRPFLPPEQEPLTLDFDEPVVAAGAPPESAAFPVQARPAYARAEALAAGERRADVPTRTGVFFRRPAPRTARVDPWVRPANLTVTPEPSSLLVVFSALGGMVGWKLRKRRKNATGPAHTPAARSKTSVDGNRIALGVGPCDS